LYVVNLEITQATNIEEKPDLQQNNTNKQNELPMLDFIPSGQTGSHPNFLSFKFIHTYILVPSNPSEQQHKRHSPPPNYTAVYPPPLNPGGQLPSSGFEMTQGGDYTKKASATYYIDGNIEGQAIIISQGG
jgi:hypothetical protein